MSVSCRLNWLPSGWALFAWHTWVVSYLYWAAASNMMDQGNRTTMLISVQDLYKLLIMIKPTNMSLDDVIVKIKLVTTYHHKTVVNLSIWNFSFLIASLWQVNMTVGQVKYLLQLSVGQLCISDTTLLLLNCIYFEQVNCTLRQVIFMFHLRDRQVDSMWYL